MTETHEGFDWFMGGAVYDAVARLTGYGPDYYRCAARAIPARPGGFFALVDWARPRPGYTAAIWTLTLLGARHTHNWRGTYADVFAPAGLTLLTDVYLDSLNRCQVFVKEPA